jgi:hypothetical protein
MPDPGTKLSSFVHVRPSGIRSINIERDLQQPSLANEYVLTAQARRTLARIVDGVDDLTRTRAWTLTGPYGSGKSYFGLFVMNLMGASLPAHQQTLMELQKADPLLAARVQHLLEPNGARGLLPVPVTGYRAPLQEALVHGLNQALQPLSSDASIRQLLSDGQSLAHAESRAFVVWIQNLLSVVSQPTLGYSGLLLLLDEMGKPLEHAAAHPTTADIYLLQELAECASRSKQTPFLFMGILHQGFERYAGNLDSGTQREWAKVQGRFEDISFQEPPDQQMRLLVSALRQTDDQAMAVVLDRLPAYVGAAVESGWLPSLIRSEEFTELCLGAYPLHPTAFVSLPHLFRRLAQNERSIFAYLASQEPFGFQEFLQGHVAPETIRLSHLFDYLAANFQGRLYASLRARPITETLERLNNGHSLSPLTTDLMKSVGLLNWLGEVSPFQATEDRLLAAMRSEEYTEDQIYEALRTLQARSLIVYRRFNHTYGIWQGSDVDVEQRLEEARRKLTGAFSLAEAVQEFLPPRPIVARRHSYQTGTIRHFEVRYVDHQTRDQLSLQAGAGASGLVLIGLPMNYADAEAFGLWAVNRTFQARADLVVCIAEKTTRLAELVSELRCLQWVKENTSELRDDPVARRELRTRAGMLETLIRNELELTLATNRLTSPTGSRWFHRGMALSTSRGLSHLLSTICDELYPRTPRLWNELINRRTLSSQGAAARRNLIEGMLTRADRPTLGIEGYPPERSMYESLLSASGLHHAVGPAYWEFSEPPEKDPLGLRPVWQAIADFVFALPPEPRGVHGLFEQLSAAPYGITDGVAPVLLCAFLIVHGDETTLYRDGTLLPEPGIADWEVLLRRPELFAVAGCRVAGLRAAVVERMARGLRVPPYVMPVVRAVIGRLKALPEHAWRTRHLPESALALRRVVEMARSPERFLFVEVPEALGLLPFEEGEFEQERFELLFERLNIALDALANATPRRLAWARDTWLAACALPAGEAGWEMFRQQAEQLAPRVTHPALVPLLKRTVESADAVSALESVLALLANRPVRTWTDADVERFEAQAQYVGRLFREENDGERQIALLPADLQIRSRQIAKEMNAYLAGLQEDPQVLRAALQELLRELR